MSEDLRPRSLPPCVSCRTQIYEQLDGRRTAIAKLLLGHVVVATADPPPLLYGMNVGLSFFETWLIARAQTGLSCTKFTRSLLGFYANSQK